MGALKKLTTPRGFSKFAYLVKPNTRFNTDGVFELTLVVPDDEAQELIGQIDALTEEVVTNFESDNPDKQFVVNKPYKMEMEYDAKAKQTTDMPTGNVEFRFKSKRKPFLLDSKLEQLKDVSEDFFVPFGSTVRVNWSPKPYAINTGMIGVSALLNAVQIIEMGETVDPTQLGFDEEEDGFTGENVPTESEGVDSDF